MPGEVKFGVDLRFAEVPFDLFALLFGDDHQRALVVPADLFAQVGVGDRADRRNDQRQGQQRQQQAQPELARAVGDDGRSAIGGFDGDGSGPGFWGRSRAVGGGEPRADDQDGGLHQNGCQRARKLCTAMVPTSMNLANKSIHASRIPAAAGDRAQRPSRRLAAASRSAWRIRPSLLPTTWPRASMNSV